MTGLPLRCCARVARAASDGRTEYDAGSLFIAGNALELVGTGMSREEAYRVVQRNAHTAWNIAGGDFRANLEADGDVTSRLSAAELADCFSTALHQENLGVIWDRLGI